MSQQSDDTKPEKGAEEDEMPHHSEDSEKIRSESQTAQDRDHTIRGGDRRTNAMKEFPG